MAWTAITLEVDARLAEPLSDALVEAGAASVAIEAGGGSRRQLSALVQAQTDAAALLAGAARAAGFGAPPRFSTEPVDDRDWVRASQEQFGPMRVGERLWVVPSWCAAPADPTALVLRLDPGLAFGTGSHPSTRLVLCFLERNIAGGERVLDYGCGSGILAIAAARLGAGAVDAVDTDPAALEATAANARSNAVALRAFLPSGLPRGRYDVVAANILARPLIDLAPALAARCRPGARLALSGLLAEQVAEVRATYAADFTFGAGASEEGWALLEARRR